MIRCRYGPWSQVRGYRGWVRELAGTFDPAATLEAAVIPMAVTMPDGRFAYANPALCNMLGYGKQDLEGRSFASLTHPDDVGTSQQRYMDLHAGLIDSFTQRKRYLTKSGQPVWVDLSVVAVRSDDGHVKHFIAQMSNANAHVAAEAAATGNVEHLEGLLDSAADVVMELDILGRIQWLSESAAAVAGQTVQALRGSNGLALLQLATEETAIVRAVSEVMAGQEVDGLPVTIQAPDGSNTPLLANLRPRFGPNGEVRSVRVFANRTEPQPVSQTAAAASDAFTLGRMSDFAHQQGGFWLDNTLLQVLRIAQEICRARYAAIDVLEADGSVGYALQIGDDGQPIRGDGREPEARDTPSAIGGHHGGEQRRRKPMPDGLEFDSFMSVPVAFEGRLLAHLRLGDSVDGIFSDRDHKHATMLAAMAAPALRNAELLGQATLQIRAADTAATLQVSALNSASESELLASFVGPVRSLVSADLLAIMDTSASAHPVVAASGTPQFAALANGVSLESAEQTRRLVSGAPSAAGEGPLGLTGLDPSLGPWALARIGSSTHSRFIALAARGIGRTAFTDVQVSMLETICSRLSFALTFGELRRAQENHALHQDRERLARDLHDLTIQRIFAVGLMLEGQTHRDHISREAVSEAVAELKGTITELRRHIASLVDDEEPMSGWELQAAALREAGRCALPAETDLRVDVHIDPHHRFDPDVVRAIVAVVREGLSNAASHASPARVRVEISKINDRLLIRVTNDGAAEEPSTANGRGRGLENLLQRARNLGGGMDDELQIAGTSTLTWWIPYPAQALHRADG